MGANLDRFSKETLMIDAGKTLESEVVELEEVVAFQACCASNIDWEAGCSGNDEDWNCSGKVSGSCC